MFEPAVEMVVDETWRSVDLTKSRDCRVDMHQTSVEVEAQNSHKAPVGFVLPAHLNESDGIPDTVAKLGWREPSARQLASIAESAGRLVLRGDISNAEQELRIAIALRARTAPVKQIEVQCDYPSGMVF